MKLDDVVAVKEAFDELGQHWPELSICRCGRGASRKFTLGPRDGHSRAKLQFRELAAQAVRHLGIAAKGTAEEVLLKFVVEEMPNLKEPDPTGSDAVRAALHRSFGEPVEVVLNAATAVAMTLVSKCNLQGDPVQLGRQVGERGLLAEGVFGAAQQPDGWPQQDLIRQACLNSDCCSRSHFHNIREAASVRKRPVGGQSLKDRYSISELRLLIKAARAGSFRDGVEIAAAWQALLPK